MDAWNTTFLLGRPIFRCELLVSGKVCFRVQESRASTIRKTVEKIPHNTGPSVILPRTEAFSAGLAGSTHLQITLVPKTASELRLLGCQRVRNCGIGWVETTKQGKRVGKVLHRRVDSNTEKISPCRLSLIKFFCEAPPVSATRSWTVTPAASKKQRPLFLHMTSSCALSWQTTDHYTIATQHPQSAWQGHAFEILIIICTKSQILQTVRQDHALPNSGRTCITKSKALQTAQARSRVPKSDWSHLTKGQDSPECQARSRVPNSGWSRWSKCQASADCLGKVTHSKLWLKSNPKIKLCRPLGKVTCSKLWLKSRYPKGIFRLLGITTCSK